MEKMMNSQKEIDKTCLTCGHNNDAFMCEAIIYCNSFREWVIRKNKKKYITEEKIEILFNSFKEFLKEKNKRYGDAALKPLKIFSRADAGSQICNRIDDKLGRIKKSKELKKNDVADIFGYVALLLIENDWLDFDDLLD